MVDRGDVVEDVRTLWFPYADSVNHVSSYWQPGDLLQRPDITNLSRVTLHCGVEPFAKHEGGFMIRAGPDMAVVGLHAEVDFTGVVALHTSNNANREHEGLLDEWGVIL